ncbi:MAG: LPS export ABC transporter periplasmic protein LptC [Salinarimonas sp.]
MNATQATAHDGGLDRREAARRAARARDYALALRHSRRVRFLRRAIPIGASLSVALLVAVTWFNPFARYGGLSLGPISVSGTRVVMDAPRLRGFQGETRPYEVTADEASQDVREPHLIDLRELRARITLDDAGNTARVEAAEGRFDTQAEQLFLRREVRVVSSDGYTIDLRSAEIDFKSGEVTSAEPVKVHFRDGTITARGLHVREGGAVITFEGRVESIIAAPDLRSPQAIEQSTGSTRSESP